MNESAEQSRSVDIEKTPLHPMDKIWRALTDSTLLTEWLLPNDFTPELGRQFKFRTNPVGSWNGEFGCEFSSSTRSIQ